MKKIASFMLSAILLLSLAVVAGAAPAEEAAPGEWEKIAAYYLEKYGTLTTEQEQMLEDLRPYAAVVDEINARDDMANIRLAYILSLDVLWEVLTDFSVEEHRETQIYFATEMHQYEVVEGMAAFAETQNENVENYIPGETIYVETSQEDLDLMARNAAKESLSISKESSIAPARAEYSAKTIGLHPTTGGSAWVSFETVWRQEKWFYNKVTGSGYSTTGQPIFVLEGFTPNYSENMHKVNIYYTGKVYYNGLLFDNVATYSGVYAATG